MWQKKIDPKPSPSAVPQNPPATAFETPKIRPVVVESPASTFAPAPVAVQTPVPIATPDAQRPMAAEPLSRPGFKDDGSGSRISQGLKIHGEISGTSDIQIDGEVQGKVRVESGILIVGPSGRVQADVEAREIVVNGHLLGNLKAADRVQVGPTGIVKGSVVSPRIGIDDGARMSGKVETSRVASSQPTGDRSSVALEEETSKR